MTQQGTWLTIGPSGRPTNEGYSEAQAVQTHERTGSFESRIWAKSRSADLPRAHASPRP